MAGDDVTVLHLVNPIARFGNNRIMGGQEQCFPTFLHNILQYLKGAPGIGGIEIAGRFVG